MREPLPTDEIDDVAATNDPVQEAIRRADLHALWLAIKQLPRQQRDALLLREFGGLRYDELAAALAVSEPSVESLLFRARARLRAQLKAAYAALTGASWLEPLARLLAGGGAPAIATKAVALGLGAAAVTGGAVVAPNVLERHHVPPARAREVVHHAKRVQTPPPVEASVIPTPVAAATTARRSVEPRRHETETQAGTEHEVEQPRTETHESHEGESRSTTTTASVSHEGERDRTTTSTTASDSHEGSGDSGGSSGPGGGDETTVPTVTEPALTVPTTTLPTDDHGGGGGGDDGGH